LNKIKLTLRDILANPLAAENFIAKFTGLSLNEVKKLQDEKHRLTH